MVLAIRLRSYEGAKAGYELMFKYNPDTLNINTILYAMGEAFFSLSIAGSGMIVAGEDIDDDTSLVKLSAETGVFDTLVGLAASLSIIPALYIFNLESAGGPSLIFVSLPAIFSSMKFGKAIAIFFYISIVFAGVISIATVFESIIDSLITRFKKFSRINAFFILGIAIFLLGLSLETVNEFTSYMNIMLIIIIPLEATLGAITWFYVMDKDLLIAEVMRGSKYKSLDKWYSLGKFVYVPVSLILTLIAITLTIAS